MHGGAPAAKWGVNGAVDHRQQFLNEQKCASVLHHNAYAQIDQANQPPKTSMTPSPLIRSLSSAFGLGFSSSFVSTCREEKKERASDERRGGGREDACACECSSRALHSFQPLWQAVWACDFDGRPRAAPHALNQTINPCSGVVATGSLRAPRDLTLFWCPPALGPLHTIPRTSDFESEDGRRRCCFHLVPFARSRPPTTRAPTQP